MTVCQITVKKITPTKRRAAIVLSIYAVSLKNAIVAQIDFRFTLYYQK